MRFPLALLLVLACAGAALVAPSAASASLTEDSFSSKALNDTIHYGVYLPPSYDSSPGKRYPVIYFLHGLTCSYICYRQIWWLGDAMEKSGREAIIIGAAGFMLALFASAGVGIRGSGGRRRRPALLPARSSVPTPDHQGEKRT